MALCAKTFAIYITVALLAGAQAQDRLPIKISSQELKLDSEDTCPTDNARDSIRAATEQKLRSILRESVLPSMCERGGTAESPAESCSDIPLECSSGWYWLQTPSMENPVKVYCDLNRTCSCSSTGQQQAWMRVAYLDMRDPSQQCPEGLRLVSEPKRACRRSRDSFRVAVLYPTYGMNYTRVCGRITGFQLGRHEGFATYLRNRGLSIDSRYVDGLSVTYGAPPNRNHIWTFATAPTELHTGTFTCPCMNAEHAVVGNITVPPFVGNDYFCATAQRRTARDGVLYTEDPLWDGQGCQGSNMCCSFNDPPWFCKTLPQSTSEDIELRMLTATSYQQVEGEDTPIEQIEIYIQ